MLRDANPCVEGTQGACWHSKHSRSSPQHGVLPRVASPPSLDVSCARIPRAEQDLFTPGATAEAAHGASTIPGPPRPPRPEVPPSDLACLSGALRRRVLRGARVRRRGGLEQVQGRSGPLLANATKGTPTLLGPGDSRAHRQVTDRDLARAELAPSSLVPNRDGRVFRSLQTTCEAAPSVLSVNGGEVPDASVEHPPSRFQPACINATRDAQRRRRIVGERGQTVDFSGRRRHLVHRIRAPKTGVSSLAYGLAHWLAPSYSRNCKP